MYKLLLSPAGRLGRQRFWLGMAVFALLVVVFNWGLRQLGGSIWAFLISLPFPFLALHMAYSIYGKRLHDMVAAQNFLQIMRNMSVKRILIQKSEKPCKININKS